jgi:ABC-type uncharacterized transport system involved in gliding motility auxiliary subunit
MKVTSKSRLLIRLQNIIFVLLFLSAVGLLAWLSTRYSFIQDWTSSNRNTLSETSITLLQRIDGPVSITAFVRDGVESAALRQRITDIVNRYQRHNKNISLRFINPELEPQLTRDQNITTEGELVVQYQERKENLSNLTEQSLTNALQRVARSSSQFVIFIEGHGERSHTGEANHGMADFVRQIENKGFKTRSINLAVHKAIPDNTAVLVLASPRVKLLAGEVRIINDYVDTGGNLLWLSEPGEINGLEPLAEKLGIEFYPGIIVDAATQQFGIADPRFTLVADYANHPVTEGFNLLTLFPQACGIDLQAPEGWQGDSLLSSAAHTWSETDNMEGAVGVRMDQGVDIPGPLNIGVALTRERPADNAGAGTNKTGQQRIVVIGDGDFLSNTYLGNSGNLDLGIRLMNWLGGDDSFIDIPAKTSSDVQLAMNQTAYIIIGLGFLIILPLLLTGSGFIVWFKRRKR